ncbi:hypothetical protein ARMSODRAFT_710887 [Armillaria solidipes]|uniref:Uncharacterized protein n=1 Tax=Armillaria solidipes TaxID=1076256 RepID=A0A2H3CA17_9AGAR|nr:hypothetical protein ARMSODRAFT_710887 [Armillaria solidipes]
MPQCPQRVKKNFLTTQEWLRAASKCAIRIFVTSARFFSQIELRCIWQAPPKGRLPQLLYSLRPSLSHQVGLFSVKTSRIHKKPDLKCVSCMRVFQAPSEVAESGGCNPSINRHHVTTAVQGMNVSPTISISNRIGGLAISRHVHLATTEMAFNGKAYECYLCHGTALP